MINNNSWQRNFAYTTGSVVFGLLIIISTNNFLGYVNNTGWIGYVSLIGYGLILVNISFVMNRRFTKKLTYSSNLSYLMATFLILPTLLWIFTKETPLGESRMVFTITIIFATYLGAWYGIKSGTRKRIDYLEKLREEQDDELPDNLRRPHDEMSKN